MECGMSVLALIIIFYLYNFQQNGQEDMLRKDWGVELSDRQCVVLVVYNLLDSTVAAYETDNQDSFPLRLTDPFLRCHNYTDLGQHHYLRNTCSKLCPRGLSGCVVKLITFLHAMPTFWRPTAIPQQSSWRGS
jgi:hypothetical protein